MENAKEFECWLYQCIDDSKKKLGMTDKTLAYILLREGTNYYLKQITGESVGIRSTKEYT